ncbi:MAG TPA: asparagine synthase-related protein, partial [Ktedonobacteraceae bacterium]|nr:asparagine synthase-related protein [Ktedonobacteraceae bacterium]
QLLHTVASETEARVAISGSGAHILAGTTIPTQPLATGTEQAGMLNWYRNMHQEEPGEQATQIWSRDVVELLQKEERWEETRHARKLARRADQFADRQQARYYLDLHLRLPDLAVHPIQQLAIQERMVVRSPYLNPRVIDMLTRLPLNLADGTSKKHLLTQLARRSMPARTKLRTASPLIVPMNSLLNIEGSDLLQQTLSPEALRASGIFEPGIVEELLKQQGKSKRELLLVFTTQLLMQLFGMEV